jgi:thiol-disulfide isomerase/thioredoxin
MHKKSDVKVHSLGSFLPVFVIIATLFFCSQAGTESLKTSNSKVSSSTTNAKPSTVDTSVPDTAVSENSKQLVVYYFMSTYRCPSCIYIEKTTKAVVENVFASQVKTGRVIFKVINIDEPANKHYDKDYKLYAQSVILSDVKDGKELRWLNLDKIWKLLNNDKEFQEYIAKEINSYLGE